MKKSLSLITVAILIVLSVTISIIAIPASAAQFPPPSTDVGIKEVVSSKLKDYLIVLSVTSSDLAEMPANMVPEQATVYAQTLVQQQAQSLSSELGRLQYEGRIEGFEVRPDIQGIVVSGASLDDLDTLSRGPAVAAILPYAEVAPACAVAAAEALSEQTLALSRQISQPPSLTSMGVNLQATDPSIEAHVSPGHEWTYISGQTAENIDVDLRILRGGQVVATQSTTSNSSGYYFFSPSWQSCPTSGYSWTLRPEDVVEVTANGNTVETVVATLSAWMDPDTDTVTGITDPGRSVAISLYDRSGDPCSSSGYSQTASPDATGNFQIDFTNQVDFDRKASAFLVTMDSNGNGTFAWFYAYRVHAEFDTGNFSGYLKPEMDFTATLSRTGDILSTYEGTSQPNGYYFGWFTSTLQSGDVVEINGKGVKVNYTATDLEVSLDHELDLASGQTGAGRLVRIWSYKRTYGSPVTTCSGNSNCIYAQAGSGSGDFSLTSGLDLVRGDYADILVYDAEGNHQYVYGRSVPAIAANLSNDEVLGYWSDPHVGYLDVILKDSGGVVKETDQVWVDSWDSGFNTWLMNTIEPSDIIQVTDGTVTETMTVQNLTSRLDGETGQLAGNAAQGHLVADLVDFRRDTGQYYSYCSEKDVDGAYNLTFSGGQVGGKDRAEVWSSGPDGHYTYRRPYAFAVNAQKEDHWVWGYSETPNSIVTVTLQRNSSPVVVVTTTSYSYNHYEVDLGDTIAEGDVVQVETGDGDSVSLPIPALTVAIDAAHNEVYGQSLANHPLRVKVRRHDYWGWYGYVQNTTANSSGGYRANFDGLYWGRDCSAIDVGHPCAQPEVAYYNDDGHGVWVEGADPNPLEADSYEPDNTSATAQPYVGVQSHTFHTYPDPDWITFTVSQADLDTQVSYVIETFNLGWGGDTILTLYDTDGSTQLVTNDDGGAGYASRIDWTPSISGTYYVEVTPFGIDSTSYCDALYDLAIWRARIYLPLIMRNAW